MRNSSPLQALFPKTRQVLLAATILQPDRWWYLSDLAKHLGLRPSSLQRELSALSKAGILAKKRNGNRIYYKADLNCPFLGDLQGLLVKTAGLVNVLKKSLHPFFKTLDFAFVYGSMARADYSSESDVDLFIIGNLSAKKLSTALKRAENQIIRSINPSLYSWEEFHQKFKDGNSFIKNVIKDKKLFVKGDPHGLAKALGREKDPKA